MAKNPRENQSASGSATPDGSHQIRLLRPGRVRRHRPLLLTFLSRFDHRMDGMYVVRFILTSFLSVFLLAASGDCASSLFAGGQAMECCAWGGCTTGSPAGDCCQVPLSGSKYLQAETNVSKEIFHSYVSPSSWINVYLPPDKISFRTLHSEVPFNALPLEREGSLPLLI